MSELYDVLRERLKMRPMVALRWIYGPKDLPAARIPNFMDDRRRRLTAFRARLTTT